MFVVYKKNILTLLKGDIVEETLINRVILNKYNLFKLIKIN